MHKIGQSGGFLGRILGPLLNSGLPLIGNVLKPLTTSVLIPLGLTASASARDATIHKKIFGSGVTTLTIFNEEMNDIMKIIKSLEKSRLIIKSVSETIKKAKERKRGFPSVLFDTLGASLLGNLLTGKRAIVTSPERKANIPRRGTITTDESAVRAGPDF